MPPLGPLHELLGLGLQSLPPELLGERRVQQDFKRVAIGTHLGHLPS